MLVQLYAGAYRPIIGGTSGVYYPVGVVLSKLLGEHVPDQRGSVQSTKASMENLNLLQQGKGEAEAAIDEYLQTKCVWINLAEGIPDPFAIRRGRAPWASFCP